jgi:surface antigen
MRATVFTLSIGLAISLPAVAVNWNFLQYGPAGQFTAEDWELLRQSGREALDKAADGDTRGWNNPATGAFGTIQPLNTYERDGAGCRRTEVYNHSRDSSGTSRFDFCKQSDGSWKVAPSGAGAAAK